MIKKTLLFCLFIFTLAAYSQTHKTQELYSESLEMTRTLRIALPDSYEQDSLKTYPLAIVLNGEYLFDLYAGNAKLFASKEKAPEQIVVGIHMEETFTEDIGFDRSTGQLLPSAVRFYQYLRDDVLFHMQENYRTSPFISLVADGYAANFISYFLGEKDAFINAYIMINPNFSVFIGDQLYNYDLPKLSKSDNRYYLYMNGNTALTPDQQGIIEGIQDALAAFDIENVHFINDNINTTYPIGSISAAIPNAMTQIFEIFAPITEVEYNTKIKDLSPDEAIEYLRNKYYNIDYLFGISMEIRENDIAAIEGIVIDKENGDKLKDFGKLLLDIRPNSPSGDYYLGLYYEMGGEPKKALKYYRQGYSKMDPSDPNADAFYENILRVGGQ